MTLSDALLCSQAYVRRLIVEAQVLSGIFIMPLMSEGEREKLKALIEAELEGDEEPLTRAERLGPKLAAEVEALEQKQLAWLRKQRKGGKRGDNKPVRDDRT